MAIVCRHQETTFCNRVGKNWAESLEAILRKAIHLFPFLGAFRAPVIDKVIRSKVVTVSVGGLTLAVKRYAT